MNQLKTFGCTLVASASLLATAQEWLPQGGIASRQYQNQIREGGQIVATEFFTLEYSVDVWLEPTGRGGTYLTCRNRCVKDVHGDHPTCDFSCDEKCQEREHKTTEKGWYEEDRAAMNAATRAANALAVQGGGTHSPSDWSHRVSSALAEFRRECRKKKTFDMPHREHPCSMRSWWVGKKYFAFHVRGTMKRTGYRMSRGVRTPINEVVGMHEQIVANGGIVQDDPLEISESTWCLCEPPRTPEELEKYYNALLETFGESKEEGEGTLCDPLGLILTDEDGRPVVVGGQFSVELVPNGMNDVTLVFRNSTGKIVNAVLVPGTFFDALDPQVQDMVAMSRTSVRVPAGTAAGAGEAQATARWACLEIQKKEPQADNKFRMLAPRDDTLLRICAITNRSRFRGPHDQARIWIYSDKASLDEINKRMIPGVTPGRYASLLWEVASRGGVDFAAPGYARCVEPKLLAGVPVSDRATDWLVETLAETHPRELARYVEGNASSLVGLLKTDPEYGPSHLATLCLAMLRESDPEIRRAAVKLMASVPADQRELFARAGGIEGARELLISGKEDEATVALDVLIAYPSEASNPLLGASWEQLPTEALKERARVRLGIEAAMPPKARRGEAVSRGPRARATRPLPGDRAS